MASIASYDRNVNRNFKTCSKHHPCEICGKPDWCSYSDDGDIASCRRQGSPEQEKSDRNGSRYYVHWLRGEPCRAFDYLRDYKAFAKPAAPSPQAAGDAPRKKRRELTSEELDKRYRQIIHDLSQRSEHAADLERLGAKLRVPAAALQSCGCVFSDGSGRNSLRDYDGEKLRCWIFPALDGEGRIVGLSRRPEKGKKKTHTGGHPGIFPPQGWEQRAEQTGIVYLVEGPTDTAALWAAGLAVVGRPSNMGGADYLAKLLRPLVDKSISFVVIGERDEKSSGLWPGRDGALHTAKKLADALGVAVRVMLPPPGVKDSREFFVQAGPALDDPAAWAECGRLLEERWEAIATVEPSPIAPKAMKPDLAGLSGERVDAFISAARQRGELDGPYDYEIAGDASAACVRIEAERQRIEAERQRIEAERQRIESLPRRAGCGLCVLLHDDETDQLAAWNTRCGCWRGDVCPRCRAKNIKWWTRHLCRMLDELAKSEVWVLDLPTVETESIRRRIRERTGQYAEIQLVDEMAVIVSSVEVPDAARFDLETAKRRIAYAVENVPFVAPEGVERYQPITTSRGWSARQGSGRFDRVGEVPDIAELRAVLAGAGIMFKDLGATATADSGLIANVGPLLTELSPEKLVRCILGWANSGTVPPCRDAFLEGPPKLTGKCGNRRENPLITEENKGFSPKGEWVNDLAFVTPWD